MNRRKFLKILGISTVAPSIVGSALQSVPFDTKNAVVSVHNLGCSMTEEELEDILMMPRHMLVLPRFEETARAILRGT